MTIKSIEQLLADLYDESQVLMRSPAYRVIASSKWKAILVAIEENIRNANETEQD